MSQKILIVDDEPKIIKLARDYLEKSGYEVLTSGNGREALAIFRQESPAMVVLDLNLPGTSGFGGLLTLRTQFPKLPIVVVSGTEDRRIVVPD